MPALKSLPVIQPSSADSTSVSERQPGSCCSDATSDHAKANGLSSLLGWSRIVLAGYATAISLVITVVVNISPELSGIMLWRLHLLLMGLTALVAGLVGPDFVSGFRHSVRRARVALELLFLLAMSGAFVYSVASVVRGYGAVYFEVIAVLLIIYAFGQRIKKAVRQSAFDKANAWSGPLLQARIKHRDGSTEVVDIDRVAVGQQVLVYPGTMIPIDGKIDSGQALVRQAAVTGESVPVLKSRGDHVLAGSICIDATLTISATSDGDQRLIDRIRQAVERARQKPARIEMWAENVARWFLPLVAVVAVATAVNWGLNGSWDQALMHASAVLLVACPCALGLATPIAIWTAISELAGSGMLCKHGDAIQTLGRTNYVCFDKTGTLTAHRAGKARFTRNGNSPFTDQEITGMIAAAKGSNHHPLAESLSQLAPPGSRFHPAEAKLIPGRGVECVVTDLAGSDPVTVRICREENAFDRGRHLLSVELNEQCVGQIEIEEAVPDGLSELMKSLKELGIQTAILSGDHQQRVETLDADHKQGWMSSGDKRAFVENLKRQFTVAFIGDGYNDAEAMAEADVSAAAAWGTEFAADTADMIWLHKDIWAINRAIRISRRASSVIRSNLWLAAGYNSVGIALAATGWLHPIAAAVLMLASSLTVTLRASSIGNQRW